MNGPHDLGGQAGFGPVAPERDEPRFHAPWERRAMALTLAAGAMGHWTIDESRHARESLHPADYYASSYYAIWIKALERLLVRHGFVTAAELGEGRVLAPGKAPRRVLRAAEVPGAMARGAPCDRDPGGGAPAFAPGDRVRARNTHPTGHTRLPRYARGKTGTVEAIRGCHVYPDTAAIGAGDDPQWLYTVVFEGTELWGPDAEASLKVSIDAFEPYLDPA
jgi:nitrile hydratase